MRLYDDRPSGTVARARHLRRDASAPELRLLRALRAAFPYVKRRHQAPIGPFFADMLCLSHHLVVEVDGDTHAGSAGYDARRAAAMRGRGYTRPRFTNAEVMENIEGVMEQVSFCLREREGAPQPSQDQGERPTKKGDAR